MPSITHDTAVGAIGGVCRITISETSVDVSGNSSQVRVTGALVNTSNQASGISQYNNISASITGTSGFIGAPFGFQIGNGIAAGHSLTFIDHTFTIAHNSDGTKSVTFSVNYSDTGTAMFGAEHGSQATLTLTTIGSKPGSPGAPVASNVLPTSMTLSWNPPTSDGGYPITRYFLNQYKGTDTTTDPSPVQYTVFGTTINLTGLRAGQDYTFTVVAYNGPGAGTGYSDPSTETTVTTLAGAWMRVDGNWVVAIPYVRNGGTWHMAVPWIRVAGVWKETH